MPNRYIKRKGIIFERIAERGDTDQVSKLQKENRQLMEKVEKLDREYRKLREASELIMSIIECMDTEDLKKKVFEKRKRELTAPTEPLPR
jgi:predicted nuclease with TOPRIM domain